MIEQFDKQLRDHIKDTFDVYDDLLEHDGWLKYQRKVKRKKYAAIFWWSLPGSVAAALAFVWLLNIGTFDTADNKTEIAKNKPNTSIENKTIITPKIIDSITKKETHIEARQLKEQSYLAEANNSINLDKNKVSEYTNKVFEESGKAILNPEILANNNVVVEDNSEITISNFDKTEVIENDKSIFTAPEKEVLANSLNAAKNSLKEKNEFNNSFSDLAVNSFANNDEVKDKPNSKKLKVGLDASTFMNFTKEGISQDMNLGVGLASELKISKNLSINSGININRQTAAYASNVENIVHSNAKSAFSSSESMAMATPVINQSSYNAKFVGFDIPLAIKYASNNKNVNWFVSTGFSSYTLLSETYSNNISVINYGFSGIQTTNEVITEEIKEDPFSNLQLARTLNFSLGLTFPIKNVTSLSVEPFVKYPLRSFGREDLTIGSSGVSLKMNLDKRLFK